MTMMPSNMISGHNDRKQLTLVAGLVVLLAAMLGAAWYFLIAGEKAVLASGLRPTEAASIVDALKARKVEFELRDQGRTIVVPAHQADGLRLDLSNSELPIKGTVGFELFNQSDMGLTDFAQKVNYQRALQGELVRTIIAMDGIVSARVHLALPERSLFRSVHSEPRAAVTIGTEPNVELDPERVAGIQRLVAAAVPDLSVDKVAILNSRGQLVSTALDDFSGSARAREASDLERFYAERVIQAVSAAAPQWRFSAQVSAIPAIRDPNSSSPTENSSSTKRDHSIRVVLFAAVPPTPAEQSAIRAGIFNALQLSAESGDELRFSPLPQMAPSAIPELQARAVSPESNVAAVSDRLDLAYSVIAAIVVACVALGLIWRRNRAKMSSRRLLIRRIREQLLESEAQHGVG